MLYVTSPYSPPHPSSPLIINIRYNPFVLELENGRHRARRLVKKFNDYFLDDSTSESLQADRVVMVKEIVGRFGERSFIDPPFRVDYWCNIDMGCDVYANFKFVILFLLSPKLQKFSMRVALMM